MYILMKLLAKINLPIQNLNDFQDVDELINWIANQINEKLKWKRWNKYIGNQCAKNAVTKGNRPPETIDIKLAIEVIEKNKEIAKENKLCVKQLQKKKR